MERTGPSRRRSRNAIRLAQCALMLTASTLALGCRSEPDSEADKDLQKLIRCADPGFIDARLETGEVEALAAERFFVLQDLRVGVPAGWKCREVLGPGSKTLEVTGEYCDQAFRVLLGYTREPSWVESPPPLELAEIRRFQEDPRGFLDSFDSDVHLLSEVFNTVPTDLDGASKEQSLRLRTLLLLKLVGYPGLMGVRRLEVAAGTAFAFRGPKGTIGGGVCDKSGRYRGFACITFPEATDSDLAESVFWQLLAMTTFLDSESQPARQFVGG